MYICYVRLFYVLYVNLLDEYVECSMEDTKMDLRGLRK